MTSLKFHPPLIVILILFISISGFTFFLGGTMPYFVFYVFLLAFIFPLIHSFILLKMIHGRVEIPKGYLFTGETIEINYHIQNQSIFSIPYLEIKSNIYKTLTGEYSDEISFSLEKNKSISHKEDVVLKRRGYYDLGDVVITIGDVFGFYSLRKTLSSNISLLVYPEPIILSTFQVAASQKPGQFSVQNSVFKDKNRVTSLREYRDGDSIRSIHWKLSAKRDSLIIKEYDNPGDNNVIIFIDNHMDLFKNDINRRLEDKTADTALSIVNYCLKENIKVSLETQDHKEYKSIQGEREVDLKAFLDLLARFKGNGYYNLTSLITERSELFNQGSTIIIITPNLNKEMGALGIQLGSKNLYPIFITIGDKVNNTGYFDPEVEKLLGLEGIPVYILDYATSIKEVLEAHHG